MTNYFTKKTFDQLKEPTTNRETNNTKETESQFDIQKKWIDCI